MTLKDLAYIIKSDRQIFLGVLVVVLVACAVLFFNDARHTLIVTQQNLQDVIKHGGSADNTNRYFAQPEQQLHLQPFDPNTADSTVLLGLGLQPWQVRSIYRYRAHGGTYTCPEDFARLYGLSVKKFRELRPYIRISPDYRPARDVYAHAASTSNNRDYYPNTPHTAANATGNTPSTSNAANTGNATATSNTTPGATASASDATVYIKKLKPGQTIDLNKSDTTALRSVPGIGAYFARRIATRRTQLGGYVSTTQLLEIKDFPESALPYFTISNTTPLHRLNINTATHEQLRNHPYITYIMASQICDYRRIRGNIKALADLAFLPTFKAETIQKLAPYIMY